MGKLQAVLSSWMVARRQQSSVLIALVVVALLNSFLAEALTLTGLIEQVTGTDFFDTEANALLDLIEWSMIALIVFFWIANFVRAARWATFAYLGYGTFTLAASVLGLVFTLTERKTPAAAFDLLWDAFVVWTINVIIFSVWYWLIDGGGVDKRAGGQVARPDFVFPQQANEIPGWANWKPGWFDYLFLAFSHSTAFSATDTAILSPRAKTLTMMQASISVTTLAMIAARAINIIA
ncbi:MAG: hypothetical protein L0Y55_03940 [Anaerolineales bacterium]|nr:hypothetical protein [Anaerolineales bacterium]